jgi:hypothetical protein
MINPDSELARRWQDSPGLMDCPIIDMHAHMGELSKGYLPRQSADEMLITMNRCNIILVCFMSFESVAMPAAHSTVDIEAVRKHPERFRSYYTVQTPHADPERDLKTFEENGDVFFGFKFHPRANELPLTDSRNTPYWEYADSRSLPVIIHTWGVDPLCSIEEAEQILNRYQSLTLIAGHSFHGRWEDAADLARKYPNLYLELTAVLDDRGAVELFCRKAGSHKILFGTDLPWFSTLHGIGAILSAQITDEERRDIFYRNTWGILKRYEWFRKIWEKAGIEAP